jgi:uncharacterized protein (TIGR02284 family)
MVKSEKAAEILNDLIKINNDRMAGYEKFAHEAKDLEPDIKNIFLHMASESKNYNTELQTVVMKLGGQPASGYTLAGKLYRFWEDLRTSFFQNNAESMLDSSESGEGIALKAYDRALEARGELPGDIYEMILNQRHSLEVSRDLIRRYRAERPATGG